MPGITREVEIRTVKFYLLFNNGHILFYPFLKKSQEFCLKSRRWKLEGRDQRQEVRSKKIENRKLKVERECGESVT